jgi:hypothetical protein
VRVEGWFPRAQSAANGPTIRLVARQPKLGDKATTGCLGMPAYFVQSHGTTIWERRVSNWPVLMTNDFCGLRFWVCRGYFEAAACGQYQRYAGGSVLREKRFRFRTCRCYKASAVTKNLRCEEACRILVALRSGKKFVVLLHSAHRSHGSSNSSGRQAVAGLTADLNDTCCAGCNNMGRENSERFVTLCQISSSD